MPWCQPSVGHCLALRKGPVQVGDLFSPSALPPPSSGHYIVPGEGPCLSFREDLCFSGGFLPTPLLSAPPLTSFPCVFSEDSKWSWQVGTDMLCDWGYHHTRTHVVIKIHEQLAWFLLTLVYGGFFPLPLFFQWWTQLCVFFFLRYNPFRFLFIFSSLKLFL